MGLKILMVTAMYPHPERPGYGAFVMQQVDQLRRFQHHVDVLFYRGYRSKLEYLKAALQVRGKTRDCQYDVIHAQYGLSGVPALARSDCPLVVTLHGSDALCGKVVPAVSRLVCRLADATIVVSEKIASKIPGVVIPCGVDLVLFSQRDRMSARERLGLSPYKKYVLFPFDPSRKVKRYDLAVAAVSRLALTEPQVELLTVFSIANSEMPWFYSAADAMILCSDSEGSPTAVKEALSCNLPLVTTDVGDVTDIVRGIPGVSVCAQTVDSLVAGLHGILHADPGFTFNGRFAMQRFSQETIIQAIVQTYHHAIQRHRSARKSGRTRDAEAESLGSTDLPA